MQVWALRNLDGTFRGKLHRHDSYDCKGRRMYEENYADRGDYVLVDLRSLPGWQGACQFECCFQGLRDAATVAAHYPESRLGTQARAATAAKTIPRGISVGQTVVYRDLASGETSTSTIAGDHAVDAAKGEVSSGSPVGRALIDREVGGAVLIELPRRAIKVEILAVED